jgi:TRAP-type C4-dicarboxylate transport system substrate-binding protein
MKIFCRQKTHYLLVILILFFAVNPLFAQRKITIKLASLVPENTPWGTAINRMAAEWAQTTNGEVEVIVYHNGAAGNENEILRKLRINQIQAAVITSMGMYSVTPEVMSVSYPFLIRNDAELDAVLRVIKPDLDARLQQSGFTTLAWARAGWIKLFSRTPISTPNDLRRLRFGTSGDDQQMLQTFRIMGYQMIPVNLTEIVVQLNSGAVEAIYQSPVFAAGTQLFGVARHMLSINVAPFMGGLILNNTAWRRIPETYRPRLMEICRRMEREIEQSIASMEAESISTMLRYGLIINELTPEQMQVWYDDTARYENNLIGGVNPVFNRDYYIRIRNILTEFRRGR